MKKKLLFFLLLSLSLVLVFTSCALFTPDDDAGNDTKVRIMVSLDRGASVDGANPVEVEPGQGATFKIKIAEGYVFKSVSFGTYDQTTGILTVPAVTKNTNVDFRTEEYFGSGESYRYFLIGATREDTDALSVKPNEAYPDGTLVTLEAKDTTREFVGWSKGKTLAEGGALLSDNRSYSFRLTEDFVTEEGFVYIYCNYRNFSDGIYYYDLNGGNIDLSSVNVSHTKYYTTSFEGGKLRVALGDKYLSYMECASTFYDDGSFIRDGYVLTEYNTKPDGTGTSYSLGSKFPLGVKDGEYPTLYCIWSEDTLHNSFTYEDATFGLPSGVSVEYAPHWVTNGIMITSYTGNDRKVVIPEKIDGKIVTAIDTGAFVNKDIETLVMGRRILLVSDGAFVGCDSLSTIYYPDGLFIMNNAALDEASYTSLKHLYVNATIAPRYSHSHEVGPLATKISRLLASENQNRIIVIAGSSTYQGLSSRYMETLLEGEYRVVNYGTTRTTNGIMYLEAMQSLAHEGDVILFAPENSSYYMGETELYYKTIRDLESMLNIYRYVDISNYTNVFGAFTDYNRNYKYRNAPRTYEEICECANEQGAYGTNKYGEKFASARKTLCNFEANYLDAYYITMNNRVKSRFDLNWNDKDGQAAHKDYTNLSDNTWCSIDDPYYKDAMNMAIGKAKESGAKVYFSFCPVDGEALVAEANSTSWLLAYDEFILDTYNFDGIVGSCIDYVYARTYFYDCAFHLNDYGRTYRTYQLYTDLCEILNITQVNSFDEFGKTFDGCLFESGSTGAPITSWSPANP